jgi:ribonucleoside-diphosphate reductase alpha chain
MFVIKRNGNRVPIRYDSITDRNKLLSYGLNVNPDYLSKLVIQSLKNDMTTFEIDELSAETAAYMSTYDPDYDILASRITVSNHHKSTPSSFYDAMKILFEYTNPKTGKQSNVISKRFMNFVEENKNELEFMIDYSRDYNYSYFGFKTLQKLYIKKNNNKYVERPQHMIMRVSITIHAINTRDDIHNILYNIKETYDTMSNGLFTHASPTLFNAGSENGSLASCFLLHMADSMEHIYETNKRCALISKHGGGIGIDISSVRAKGSPIHSTNGQSDGILPMCQVLNATSRYSNQSGLRKGSFAVYLQPWHSDIFEFLGLRLNNPPEELRARDLFLAMWIPDIFMRRVENDEEWSLFCPSTVPLLTETYGEEFEKIYLEAEQKNIYTKQVKARDVWKAILQSQIETGLPYIAYKDSVNKKSNQKNIGIIRSLNLCMEIAEFTDDDSVAVCNLASIALPKFIQDNDFNFEELGRVVRIITRNLNKVIDNTFYPVKEAKSNNLLYRPIGIGVQGLADVFAILKYSWNSNEAKLLNRKIFETIYYYALDESANLGQYNSYHNFYGSPVSQGILQYHMWETEPTTLYDWKGLIEKCKKGVRNSLLVAPMPTASTSQLLGWNEAFEPFTSNIYSRSTLAGDFMMVNKHLYKDLKEINLWNKDIVNKIIENNGSVQSIDEIPSNIKELYKTVWEISQKIIIDMAADRGAFIDQSQSMNIFIDHPTQAKLSSMHLYGWKKGLKTGSYYIRSKPARNAVKFTIMKEEKNDLNKGKEYYKDGQKYICTEEVCINCSS